MFWSCSSALESIALKAAMVMPALLLQRPFWKFKPCDHTHCLERRLPLWLGGDIDALVAEGTTIQDCTYHHTSTRTNACVFVHLMFQGKVSITNAYGQFSWLFPSSVCPCWGFHSSQWTCLEAPSSLTCCFRCSCWSWWSSPWLFASCHFRMP